MAGPSIGQPSAIDRDEHGTGCGKRGAYPGAGAYADAYGHTVHHTHIDQDAHTHPDAEPDAHTHPDANADGDLYPDPNRDSDSHPHKGLALTDADHTPADGDTFADRSTAGPGKAGRWNEIRGGEFQDRVGLGR